MKHAHHDEFTTEFELSQDELLGKRDERRLVELNGYIIRDDKTIIDVKIVDLSYDGCAVRTLQPLRIGEKIKLTVLGRDAMNAVVRWYRHRRAGLLFEFESPQRAQWPRKAKRLQVSGELALRRAGSINYRVRAIRCDSIWVQVRICSEAENLRTRLGQIRRGRIDRGRGLLGRRIGCRTSCSRDPSMKPSWRCCSTV